jgi:hypothetical protein
VTRQAADRAGVVAGFSYTGQAGPGLALALSASRREEVSTVEPSEGGVQREDRFAAF